MPTIEVKPHIGRTLGKTRREVRFDQDIVWWNYTWYDEQGECHTQRTIAGYCDVAPGSPFRPIINGIPETVMSDIKAALAERDGVLTGQEGVDYYERRIMRPPPIMEDEHGNRGSDETDDE